MSDEQLQRVTGSVAYIGQATMRRALPARPTHITQKVRIAGQRTLCISVHDDEHPAEIFLWLKRSDCTSELIGLDDVIARLMSIGLQHGASLAKLGDLLSEAKYVTSVAILRCSLLASTF